MNKEEFESGYAQRSGVTVEWLHKHGRYGAPCNCGEAGCEGWAMLYSEDEQECNTINEFESLQRLYDLGIIKPF